MSELNEKELNEIHIAVDLLMKNDCWGLLDDLLDNLMIRAWRTDIYQLLAYATATLPGKDKLPSRTSYVGHCKRLFPKKGIWEGLE